MTLGHSGTTTLTKFPYFDGNAGGSLAGPRAGQLPAQREVDLVVARDVHADYMDG